MVALTGYWWFVAMLRTALFYVGLVAAALSLLDWAARTRRLSPFSAVARFFRTSVDPFMAPVERMVARTGGRPSMTPWWSLVILIVAAILLVGLLDFVGGIIEQVAAAAAAPQLIPKLALSWAFSILRLALIVRVVASWTPVSPRSAWIRWSYALTEWMLAPLRRIIPLVGMVDITPLVAWLLLSVAQSVLRVP